MERAANIFSNLSWCYKQISTALPFLMYAEVMTDFESHFPPINGRTHETCGASAASFALVVGGLLEAQTGRPVLWVQEAWRDATLNPVGAAIYLDPKQLLLAKAPSQLDALAVAEEALRSGDVALVVMELSQPIGLTEGRRLQLAAQAGQATGLCLLPEGMGSNTAQTRWHCAPVFDDRAGDKLKATDSTLQRWEITKNKSGTLKAWTVEWHAQTRRISVVSQTAQR